MIAYSIVNGLIQLVINGDTHSIPSTHRNYGKIFDALKEQRFNDIPALADIVKCISVWGNGMVKVVGNTIEFNDRAVDDTAIVERMLKMIEQGEDITPMANFLTNLFSNPDQSVIPQLYRFLRANNLPITKDGYFLAYRAVTPDYKDYRTGKFDNSIGMHVKENRASLCADPTVTCAKGLHACSWDYLSGGEYGVDRKLIIVKINPRDVVSVPNEYKNSKLRVCEFLVLEDAKDVNNPMAIYESRVVWDSKPKEDDDELEDEELEDEELEDEDDEFPYDDFEDEDDEEDEEDEEEKVSAQKLKTGQVVYRDAKGHFVKKS